MNINKLSGIADYIFNFLNSYRSDLIDKLEYNITTSDEKYIIVIGFYTEEENEYTIIDVSIKWKFDKNTLQPISVRVDKTTSLIVQYSYSNGTFIPGNKNATT